MGKKGTTVVPSVIKKMGGRAQEFKMFLGKGLKKSPMKKYKKIMYGPLKRELKGDQDKLPEVLKDAIKKAGPLKRRFCGGSSKPYKK